MSTFKQARSEHRLIPEKWHADVSGCPSQTGQAPPQQQNSRNCDPRNGERAAQSRPARRLDLDRAVSEADVTPANPLSSAEKGDDGNHCVQRFSRRLVTKRVSARINNVAHADCHCGQRLAPDDRAPNEKVPYRNSVIKHCTRIDPGAVMKRFLAVSVSYCSHRASSVPSSCSRLLVKPSK
jgi:hypothetical protein